jgi:hypothetical protein
MKVTFERSGGFAGIKKRTELDTNAMSPDDAGRLRALVDAAGFFNLPEGGPRVGGRAIPDRFNYRITIDDAGRQHTVQADEAALAPAVRPLIEFLSTSASRTLRTEGGGRPTN